MLIRLALGEIVSSWILKNRVDLGAMKIWAGARFMIFFQETGISNV